MLNSALSSCCAVCSFCASTKQLSLTPGCSGYCDFEGSCSGSNEACRDGECVLSCRADQVEVVGRCRTQCEFTVINTCNDFLQPTSSDILNAIEFLAGTTTGISATVAPKVGEVALFCHFFFFFFFGCLVSYSIF